MINPYYTYIFTFLTSLLIYNFGWSTLFPSLKPSLIAFFLITIVLAAVLGFFFQTKRFISFRAIAYHRRIPITVILITALWMAEFAYNRGIPLFLILRGQAYNYIDFGIPTVHVFVVTFTSFFSVYLFHVYLSTKQRRVLLCYFVTLFFPILLFNRGMLMINVVSSLFVYLQFTKRFSVSKISLIATLSLFILYGFGVLGNLRTSHNQGGKYSDRYILELAHADEKFVNGIVPTEFIWSYLYISSPIGNLQYNIDRENTKEFSKRNLLLFVNNELLFDFISKRVNQLLDTKRVICMRFADFLTVASVYTNSYIYMGWIGLATMAVFILAFPIFYLGLIRKSNTFYVTGASILCSLYLFLIFDNMFAFTGLSFQLVYPVLLGRVFREPAGNAGV